MRGEIERRKDRQKGREREQKKKTVPQDRNAYFDVYHLRHASFHLVRNIWDHELNGVGTRVHLVDRNYAVVSKEQP